jgi:hypothetical protein
MQESSSKMLHDAPAALPVHTSCSMYRRTVDFTINIQAIGMPWATGKAWPTTPQREELTSQPVPN